MAFGADIAELIVALRLDDRGFSGRLNNATRSLRGMNAGMSQMGRGAGQLGAGLARVGAIAVTATGGAAFAVTKWAIDTETAFAGVKKTVDETANTSYADLNEQLDKLASRKPQDWAELAQIGEFGGQLGVTADNLSGFVDTVSDFLVAVPQMGLEEAAFGLQRISVLTKVADEDLDRVASTIVELGNNFATTESAIIATTERFASQATAIGLSTQASLGLSAALTALGGEPQEAGTSMQRLFQRINLALAEGGKKAELFADVSGVSAAKFRSSWERDAEGTLLMFLKGMGDANLSAIEQTAILDDLGLADARLGKNVLNLANNMDVTEGALESANAEWKTNTALAEEAQKRYDTLASKLKVLRNNLMLAGVTIGSEVMPVVADLSTEFTAFLQKPETIRGIQDFAKQFGEDIRNLVSEVRKFDWGPLISGLEVAGRVAKSVLDIFKSLPAPLQGLIVGGLALNKLSGGLLGAGAGNILGGGIKVALGMRGQTPANPMFVSDVTGGLGGAAGKGGGVKGLLGTAMRIAVPAAVAAFAVNQAWQGVPEAVTATKKGEAPQNVTIHNAGPLARLTAAEHHARGAQVWQDINSGVRDANGRLTTIDANMLQTANRVQGQIEMTRAAKEAASFDAARLSTNVVGLKSEVAAKGAAQIAKVHELNMSEGTRFARLTSEVSSKGAQNIAATASAREAVRATQGPLNTIAAKDFSTTMYATIPVNVNVSATVLANQMYRQQYTQSATFSQSTNTGGV